MADPLLSDVVTDLCRRAGLTPDKIDITQLTPENLRPSGRVAGYCVQRNTVATETLRPLMQAYFFDACESEGKIKFVPRGVNPPVMTIPDADLGLKSDNGKLVYELISQEQDLPLTITVLFNDPAIDYQQGKQLKSRSTRAVATKNQITMSLPITLQGDQARQIAEIFLFQAWLERNSFQFNLWRAIYLRLDPTDVVNFVYDGDEFEVRITADTLGQGYVVQIDCVNQDARNYISHVAAAIPQGFVPPPPRVAGPTLLFLFDTPLMRDSDALASHTGYYYAMANQAVDFLGAALMDSVNGADFAQEDIDPFSVSYGYAVNALGNPATPFDWDGVNQLTVRMVAGTLAGDTEENLINNGANALLVGNPATQIFELVQFQNAVDNGDGTFTVSTLARGRRGTEWAAGFWGDFANGIVSHAAGDLVVVLQTGARRIALTLDVLQQLRYYKAVTLGQDPSTASVQTFTDTGNDLRPYAPVKIGGTLDASGNVILTWARRTRIGGGNAIAPDTDPADTALPLSEDSEAYEIDIKSADDSTVLRTLKGIGTTTANYSLAQQVQDFGAAVATLVVDVYQMSAEIGRGFKGHAVIDLTLPPPIPPPTAPDECACGTVYVNLG